MKKEKGFTLIELLGVLILLAILLMIVVPSIQKYMRKGTSDYYHNLEKTLFLSGKDYLNDYRTLLPREIGNVTVIPLEELTKNKYIDNVVDTNEKECQARVVAKKTGTNDYEYYTCLICEGYQTEGEACEYSEDNNVTEETKDYEIKIEDTGEYEIDGSGVYIVDQGIEFDLPYGKAYYKGELVNDKVVPNPNIIDTNKLGEVKVSYAYHGAKTEIRVRVVDRVAPSIPQIILRKENKKGNRYIGGWYSGNIYEEYESIDYSKKEGVLGSGIAYYEISTDGINYSRLESNYHISIENGTPNYYVRAVDRSGNIGDSNHYGVKIDKEIPRCSLEVKSGTLGSNGWYTSNITVGFKNITETVSDIGYQTISQTTVINNTRGITITAMVTDLAGNVGSCSLGVKVDKEIPTITANSENTYIDVGSSSSPANYFRTTQGISGASVSCTVNNVNQLALGVNRVTCTITGENGLTASSSTVFRHQYIAATRCSGGRSLSNGECTYYYQSNEDQCGCGQANTCRNPAFGVELYNERAEAPCDEKSCPNNSCSCARWESYCPSGGTLNGKYCIFGNGYGDDDTGCSNDASSIGASCAQILDGQYYVHKNASSRCAQRESCKNGSACGYYSCRNEAFGVELYKEGTNLAVCGCQIANSCTKTENNYRYYECDRTGNNGTNGTLNGTTCSF